ncbi:ABC transporter ATP-binding protein [Candidatus Contubernalis alkaliaceticus]|uniref:ABC transporter ATP-binding protein n=1 Tax=Candidatus Contubernalis alkaliaceticus TaxID=338645 RepID=UPI001F4C0319|nr:ABC transporter ATP-binding protein [Candidatus Contubernalis alkalaceticus]UNC93922.1 ABC transporter ATP-binding protein [Candidatus Contubernalis alkalaceticus]
MNTQELAVGYGKKIIIDQINLEVLKGQLICLLGPNGSGKSTILKSLCGFLAPVQGTVYLKNQNIFKVKSSELAKNMAVVLTERLSPGLMTSFDIASMGRHPHTGFFGYLTDKDVEKTREALRMVNAWDIAYQFFNELSDGQKQKVMLARALAQEPEIIVLDEPTTHLDVRHRIEVMGILNKLSREKGITVILSLHEVDLALKSCEIAILVKDNKILACGPPEEIIKENTVTELFDINCAHFNNILGSVELCSNNCSSSIFIIGGGGSATGLYRLLSRRGYGVSTGVIHENDVDYHVAKATGAVISSEKAFEPIGDGAFKKANSLINSSNLIIDSGFPAGFLNKRNISLAELAIKKGKRIYALRDEAGCRKIYGAQNWDSIICCKNSGELFHHITPDLVKAV